MATSSNPNEVIVTVNETTNTERVVLQPSSSNASNVIQLDSASTSKTKKDSPKKVLPIKRNVIYHSKMENYIIDHQSRRIKGNSTEKIKSNTKILAVWKDEEHYKEDLWCFIGLDLVNVKTGNVFGKQHDIGNPEATYVIIGAQSKRQAQTSFDEMVAFIIKHE